MIDKKQFETIDDFIASYPPAVQTTLRKLRNEIKKAAPEAGEKISYGIPTFTMNGNLVHFAASKKHIGFYPTPSAIEAFKKELSVYETAKGTIRFPINQPLPLDLIRRIVQFRVKENQAQKKS